MSRLPPSAAPLSAATTGLPRVSRRRRSALIFVTAAPNSAALSSVTCESSVRSPPAKKVLFPDVTITPAIESFSAYRRSTAAAIDSWYARVIVLARWLGSSRVSVTIPSASWSQRMVFVSVIVSLSDRWGWSDTLDDGGDTHAAADAQGGHAVALVAALEFVDERAENHGAGRAEGMAEGNRSAVDVDLLVRHVEVLHELHHDRGESLVGLEQIDVAGAEPGLGECFHHRRPRTREHDRRFGGDDAGRDEACPRRQAEVGADPLTADQHQGGAVDDAGRVARRVKVVDLLEPVVLLQRDRIEAAHLAECGERGLQCAERLDGRARARELIVVEHDVAVDVDNRDERAAERAVGYRFARAGLRFGREAIEVLTTEALDRADEVGADALRHEARGVGRLRVHGPGAAVGAHRDARHRLHPAGDEQILPARAHLLGGDVHGFEAGRAETVDLEARSGAVSYTHLRAHETDSYLV